MEQPVTDKCVKCGRGLVYAGAGRPPKWCSVGCRRAGEYEVRRIVRRLADVEERLPGARRVAARERAPGGPSRKYARQCAIDLEQDRHDLEERLRQLLDDVYEEANHE